MPPRRPYSNRDENIRQQILSQEIPNRRQAVAAFNESSHRVYATSEVAKKLYRCAKCAGDLTIGTVHVVTRSIQLEGRFDHHHLHESCFREKVLPSLGRLAIIDANEATLAKNNRRARRSRYQNRKKSY